MLKYNHVATTGDMATQKCGRPPSAKNRVGNLEASTVVMPYFMIMPAGIGAKLHFGGGKVRIVL
jgi:hypothetical protein